MSNRRQNGPGPIPKRWLNCPIRSDKLIADKFIAFKTPLSSKFDSQVDDKFFYPNMIFDLMKSYYKKKIGLWIDLTNTSRFYDRSDVEKNACKYVKLQCRGHGETPSEGQTLSFINIVDDFISQNPLEIVAVHCTHGFNRTGFLIASYLYEKHDYSIDTALRVFADARPPGIYKQDYILELFKRFEDESEPDYSAPMLPDWCNEEEEADDFQEDEAAGPSKRSFDDVDGEAAEEPKKKRRKQNIKLDAVFMDGVGGVTLETNEKKVHSLQEIAQNMCGWKANGFPGSQPVSMTLRNIEFLKMKPYKVSWKADGTRYMMLILQENEIYFFDRDNSCFKIDNLTFPYHRDLTIHLKRTLLDGEMVIDRVNGQNVPRYLVYDIIRYNDEDCSKLTFEERLKIIKNNIIGPRHEAIRRRMINRDHEPFGVRNKDFWDVTQAAALLGPKFAQQLSHEPDGLIFQPKMEPYIAGRCDDVLKWKPPEQNSVDFLLKIVTESGVGMLTRRIGQLFVGSFDQPFSIMKFTRKLLEYNNKIIECKYENNEWVFMRERTDKSFPNAYTTAVAVCESIKNPVSKGLLLDYIDRKRFRDDCEDMPPPGGRQH